MENSVVVEFSYAGAFASLVNATIPWAITVAGITMIFWFLSNEYRFAKEKLMKGSVHFTYKELILYRTDYHFSTTESAKAVLLMGTTFILMVSATFALYLVTGDDIGNCMWHAWVWIVDNGSHGEVDGLARTVVAWMTTIAGMLVFAMFIGIVSDSIQETLDSLRKGHCRVIESGHTVMLGWNSKSICILQQLALANRSIGGGIVAVLCERSKEEMEQVLETSAANDGFDLHGTRIIFRCGNPMNSQALTQISASAARAILVMSDERADPDEADALTLRQILVLKSLPELCGHVVAEVCRVDNVEWIAMVDSKGIVEPIVPRDITGRVLVQSSRVAGLARVIEQLMDFGAASFYHSPCPELVGCTFGEALCRFKNAVPIGVQSRQPGNGPPAVLLNPPCDLVIGAEDELVVIAEDDDTYAISPEEWKSDCAGEAIRVEALASLRYYLALLSYNYANLSSLATTLLFRVSIFSTVEP